MQPLSEEQMEKEKQAYLERLRIRTAARESLKLLQKQAEEVRATQASLTADKYKYSLDSRSQFRTNIKEKMIQDTAKHHEIMAQFGQAYRGRLHFVIQRDLAKKARSAKILAVATERIEHLLGAESIDYLARTEELIQPAERIIESIIHSTGSERSPNTIERSPNAIDRRPNAIDRGTHLTPNRPVTDPAANQKIDNDPTFERIDSASIAERIDRLVTKRPDSSLTQSDD